MSSNNKKIVLFFSSLENGGGRTFAVSFVKLMKNYVVLLASIRNKEETEALAKSLGVGTIDVISLSSIIDESVLLISNSQICALIGSIFYSGRHYYVTHGFANGLPFINGTRALVWKLQIQLPGTKLIACGDSEYRAITSILGKSNRVSIVRNASINNTIFEKSNSVCKPRGRSINLLFIGRISLQKGLDILLRSLIILQQKGISGFTLTVIGPEQKEEKKFRSEISNLLSELKVQPTILPAQKVTPNLFSSYDALVMPSRFEGLPYLLLEAASFLIPVIVSNCDGCNDVVVNEMQGHIFNSEDPESLAKTLLSFRDASDMSINERVQVLKVRAEQLYSTRAFSDGYDKILAE